MQLSGNITYERIGAKNSGPTNFLELKGDVLWKLSTKRHNSRPGVLQLINIHHALV